MVDVSAKEDPNDERYEDEEVLITHVSKNDAWIIDIGCSHQMAGDICNFHKPIEYNGELVKLANDVTCLVKGRG